MDRDFEIVSKEKAVFSKTIHSLFNMIKRSSITYAKFVLPDGGTRF